MHQSLLYIICTLKILRAIGKPFFLNENSSEEGLVMLLNANNVENDWSERYENDWSFCNKIK